MIKLLKTDIDSLKRSLQSQLDTSMWNLLIDMFNRNNWEVKNQSKLRLSRKMNWLIYKYYSHEWYNWQIFDNTRCYEVTYNPYDPRFHAPHCQQTDMETNIQSACDKVTCINLEDIRLPPATKELLALGPGYAIAPDFREKNKEKLVKEICDKIAECAIGVRWSSYFSQTPSVQTLEQHLKSTAPFDKKYAKPPPTDDLHLENRLINFQTEVCKIVRATTVSQNITTKQRQLLRDLKQDNNLHISIADKTSEFVVMKNNDHIKVTKQHFDHHAYKKWRCQHLRKRSLSSSII